MEQQTSVQVLCLDDDFAVAQLVARLVEECGYTALPLTDPHEVRARLADLNLKAVLSDFVMPLHDGISVLTEVLRLRPDVRRVLVTAAPHGHLVLEAARLGRIDRIIPKPLALADIESALSGLD